MIERPTRREAEHDARLDAQDEADATGSATFLSWCDYAAGLGEGPALTDYPRPHGGF